MKAPRFWIALLLPLLAASALYAQDPPGAKRFTNQMMHNGGVSSVCFSPDGRYALSGSGSTIKLWEVNTGNEIRTLTGHTSYVSEVCFSPDGLYILSASSDKTLKLWEVSTGNQVRTMTVHATNSVHSVCFSPDGRYALSGSDDGIQLWNVATGQEIRTLKGHTNDVHSVCFSPDGRYALSGSWDKTLKLWNVSTGKEVRTLRGHTNYVNSVCFSPDGRYALSGSSDHTIKLWEVNTGKRVWTIKADGVGRIGSVCFSPDGRHILSSSGESGDYTSKLWEAKTGKLEKTLIGHINAVDPVCFSPDGRYALSGSSDNTVKLWDIRTGKEVRTPRGHKTIVESVSFSPDGQYALSDSEDRTLKLWDVNTGKEVRTIKRQANGYGLVSFSPDGRYALIAIYKTLKLLEVGTGKEVWAADDPDTFGLITSICLSPDGKYALSGSLGGTLKFREVSTGKEKEVRTLRHSGYVNSVCFSPDGKYALSGSSDRTLKLWEVSTGEEVRTLSGHTGKVRSVCFSPDGKYALSGSWYHIKLWDLSTGKEVRTLSGHTSYVSSVCFSPDGRYALSSGDDLEKHALIGIGDRTIRLWNVATGEEVRKWSLNYHPNHVSFSADGSEIQVGTAAYFVNFPLTETVDVKPAIVQNPIPVSTFSQLIWTSPPATVRELVYTARAVLVSNYPNPIQAEQIRVYVNGQLQTAGQKLGVVSLKAVGGRYNWQQTIPLTEGNNEVVLGLTLPNQPELRSEPLVVEYLPPTKPNLYVLTIGVPGMGLKHPAKDAEAIGELLKKQQGKLFNRVIATSLTQPEDISTTHLRNEMSTLPQFGITPNDILLVFISAHGKKLNLRNGQTDFAIQPIDYNGANIGTEENTTLRYKTDIIANIENIPCLKMIWLDACHSGEAVLKPGGKDQYLRDLREAQEIIKRTPAGIVTLSSSSDGQLSWEDDAWQHGAFTKALLDGLAGAADANKDGFVWVSELFGYLQTTIPPLVKQRKGATQEPQMYPPTLPIGHDFPLVRY
jgi:WD40 repeat protein